MLDQETRVPDHLTYHIVAGVFGSFPKIIVKRKLFVKAFAIAIC